MKSWKTTLIGCIGAIANAIVPLYNNGSVDAQTLAISAFMALFGFFAKDWNATGVGGGAPPDTKTTVTVTGQVAGRPVTSQTTETKTETKTDVPGD